MTIKTERINMAQDKKAEKLSNERKIVITSIADAEKYIKKFSDTWKKEIDRSNKAIVKERATPITRSNDARIKRIINNTNEIIERYAAELQDVMVSLDAIGEEAMKTRGADEEIVSVIELMSESFEKLHIETDVKIRGNAENFKYRVDSKYANLSRKWKRRYDTLPSVKIEALKKELKSKEKDYKAAQKDVSDSKLALENLTQLLDGCLEKKEEKEKELTEEKKDYESKKEASISKRAELNGILENLNASKERDADVIAKLIGEIAAARRDAENKSGPYRKELESERTQLNTIRNEIHQLVEEEKLKKDISEKAFLFKKRKSAEYEDAHSRLVQKRQEFDTCEFRIAEIEKYISEIEIERDGIIKEYTREKDTWDNEKKTKLDKIDDIEEKRKKIEEELDAGKRKITGFEEAIKDLDKEIKVQKKKIKEAEKKHNESLDALKIEETEKGKIEGKIQKLKDVVDKKVEQPKTEQPDEDAEKDEAKKLVNHKENASEIAPKVIKDEHVINTQSFQSEEKHAADAPAFATEPGLTVSDEDALRLGIYDD